MKGITFLIIILSLPWIDHTLETDQAPQDFAPFSQEIPGSDLSIDMMPVPGGTFTMESAETPSKRDVLVDDFWMGTYEITWQQYDLFTKEVVSRLSDYAPHPDGDVQISADAIALPTPPYVDMSFGMGRDGYPAINMTHYAAVMFTKWLTAKTGVFYRLPTEAEWEFACRSGASDEAGEPDRLDEYEWHQGNSGGSYNKIGTRKPNSIGLNDMKGNVAEWTTDQYLEDYLEQLEGEVADNPWFKPTALYPRAVRGGSWRDEPEEIGCTQRRGSRENWKMLDPQFPKSLWWHTSAPFLGFRIVRPVAAPSAEAIEEYWIGPMEDL
ncbi:MAG: SUMF1/EgtB/PvdO family nonheme iron enzyme [Balneolales bacterium]